MDNIMEKFDLFDFFNLIIGGFTFFTGIGFYDNHIKIHICQIIMIGGHSTFSTIIVIAVFIMLSYIVGLVFHTLGYAVFQDRYHNKLISGCLREPSVVGNETKYYIYRENAKNYFASKQIRIKNDTFSKEQSSCFFAHCLYYIQVREKNQKAEKLKDIQGMSRILMMSFGALFFSVTAFVQNKNVLIPAAVLIFLCVATAMLVFYLSRDFFEFVCIILAVFLYVSIIFFIYQEIMFRQLITSIICGMLAILFFFKYKKDVSNRVRMILAVYDVCQEMDREDKN